MNLGQIIGRLLAGASLEAAFVQPMPASSTPLEQIKQNPMPPRPPEAVEKQPRHNKPRQGPTAAQRVREALEQLDDGRTLSIHELAAITNVDKKHVHTAIGELRAELACEGTRRNYRWRLLKGKRK